MIVRKFALATLALGAIVALVAAAGGAGAKVGSAAPDFKLSDNNGKTQSLSAYKGKYVVLEWTNKDCPFVKKHYGSGSMQATQKWAKDKGVVWLSVISSAPNSQGYLTPAEANDLIKKEGINSKAIVFDSDGKVGRAYGAKTTPHMFVIDPKGVLIYNGGIDDKPTPDKASLATAKNYVKAALEESMAGKAVSVPTSQPYGCSVKYAE